jgi:hypothetical protein
MSVVCFQYIVIHFVMYYILDFYNKGFIVKIGIYKYIIRNLDWVAQSLIEFKCELKFNWHLQILEVYII